MKVNLKLGLLAVLTLGRTVDAIKLGDARMDVVAELGAPTGFIRAGKDETLYYERGTIQLQNGKVVNFEIMTPEQLRERQAAAERIRAEQTERLVQLRAQLKTEGEAALKKVLADPDFVNAAPAAQVARWREFMKKYPDVPVGEYYLPALKRYEEEQAHTAQDQRIAALEQRLQEAEQRAMLNDTRRMQYPSLYVIQPSVWYRPPFGIDGAPRREHTHGPQRSSGTSGLTGGVTFSF
ncbi:MAG: hypothetical protein NTY53_16625 [Kiritimatiellaeota bacterium]|nr:hypothetical protein [Kiritimatiellota bacterium]